MEINAPIIIIFCYLSCLQKSRYLDSSCRPKLHTIIKIVMYPICHFIIILLFKFVWFLSTINVSHLFLRVVCSRASLIRVVPAGTPLECGQLSTTPFLVQFTRGQWRGFSSHHCIVPRTAVL